MKGLLVIAMALGILLAGCAQEQMNSMEEEAAASPSEAPPHVPELVSEPTEPEAASEETEPDSDQACIDAKEGKTTYNGEDYADYCLSYNVIYEYYCENDVLKQKQVMCAATEKCENGICVEDEEHECTDTDGGENIHKKGTITYWSGGQQYSETDKCAGAYSVLEVWCTETNSVGFGIIECSYDERCEDGRCVDD